jgi:hypothetical protein
MKHENENQPLARREELVVKEMPDEVLVYDLRQHKAHCLNKTAAFIWDHCDGKTTVTDLTKLMGEEFKLPVDENLIWHALERLDKADLLVEKINRLNSTPFRSRRAVLGKLSTAALLSVPVVMSIISPAAAAAGSVPAPCVACSIFGSGSNRTNVCPAVCDATIIGECFNNASCNGVGGQLPDSSCQDCFSLYPTSSSWRVIV